MGGQGSKAGGIGYSEDIAPTIKSVLSGGNTVPDVVYALQGNGIDRADTAGCNGKGWREDICYTLNTIDRPAVVCVDQGGGKSNCTVDEQLAPPLACTHGGTPSVCVMAHGQSNAEIVQNMSPTLNCNHEQPIVSMDTSFFNTEENRALPLLAKCYKDPPVIAKTCGAQSLNCAKPPRKYIVRRLTPLECCRLQGFPDGWGDLPAVETFTDDEVEFWEDVRRTHAQIMSKKYTPARTTAALVNWYNKLHTDSAEYKMWGNGIALPCARFVLEGIAMEGERMQ